MEINNEQLLQQLLYLESLLHRYQNQAQSFHGFANPHRGQGRVLMILAMQEEITQKELGYLLDMRNQSLSELLAKLEQKGLITRAQAERDRRTTLIRLTTEGKQMAMQLKLQQEQPDSLFDELQQEEKEVFASYLQRLIDALKQRSIDSIQDERGFDEERRRAFFDRRTEMIKQHIDANQGQTDGGFTRRGPGNNGFRPF